MPLAVASLTHLSLIACARSCTPLTSSGDASLICVPTRFISSSAAASVASHALPASSANGSPETDNMASWSCFDSLFHLSSFMKKPNEELEKQPGNSARHYV